MSATPRYRHPSFWTGRIVRVSLLAFIALAVLRISWGRSVAAKVEAQWAEARQRGEWTTAGEFEVKPLPADQNAWTLQLRAAQAIAPDIYSPRNSNMEYTDYPPYGPLWTKAAEQSEKANLIVFQLVRQARSRPNAQLRHKMDFTWDGYIPSSLNSGRNLANTLCDGAQLAEVKGDHLEAVERLRDALHLARSIRTDPTLVSQLVASGIDALSCNSICIVAPGLNLRTPSPALRRAVVSLIAELLDESLDQRQSINALMAERIFAAEFLTRQSADRWAIMPLAVDEIARGNAGAKCIIEAARQPDLTSTRSVIAQHTPAWRKRFDDETLTAWYGDRASDQMTDYSQWFGGVYYYSDRWIARRFQSIAERRLAATVLAMQLFRADHNRWPEKLNELTPTYLSAIPKDPFRIDAGPIAYSILRKALPDRSDRPLISYEFSSVNTQDARHWSEPIYGFQQGVSGNGRPMGDVRQYRDVTRFRPPGVTIREIDGYTPPPPDPAPDALPPGTEPDPDNPCTPRERKKEEPKPDAPEKK